MRNKYGVLQTAIITAVVVSAGWLAFVVIALVAGVPFQATSALAGLLATIGGIMGAIFAVGGLVIALVAVLTQLQLQDRVTRVLTEAQSKLEDKFTKEIRPIYEAETQRQIEGTLAFFQATIAGDWKAAVEYTKGALEKYPKLSGARSFLALRLSGDVENAFYNQLRHGVPMPGVGTISDYINYNYPLYPLPGAVTTLTMPVFPASPFTFVSTPPPSIEALEWLNLALQNGDDPEGQVSSALVLMYAVNGAYDKMEVALRAALQAHPASRSYLLTALRLNLLAYACGNTKCRMERVGEALEYPLPLSKEDIINALQAEDWQRTEYADWYAVEAGTNRQASPYAGTVRIFRPRDGATGKEWYAYVIPHDGQQQTVPTPEADKSGQMSIPPRTLEALVDELCKRWYFVCPSGVWPLTGLE